jgi:hypothetical protein
MVWGLTGGLAAGVFGGWSAELVHLPTRVLLTWVSGVARWAAVLPLGALRAGHVVGLAIGLTLVVAARWRSAGLLIAASSVAAAIVVAQAPPPLRADLVPGITRWHAADADVVVLGGVGGRTHPGGAQALAALRAAGVGGIDLLVVADASIDEATVRAIERRHAVAVVMLAAGAGPLDTEARVIAPPAAEDLLVIGALEVHVTATTERLVVDGRAREPAR